MKQLLYGILMFSLLTTSAFATVIVTSPSNGSTVGSTVQYTATATTTCSKGVASMGIYVNNQLDKVVDGASMNTTISLGAGSYYTVVEEWDYCGGATTTPVNITVSTQSGVSVSSPANNSTVGSPATYVATATSSCSKGVASMGVYVNNQLVYVTQGAKLDTQISLGSGSQHTVVEDWDYCGGASYTTINVTVASGAQLSAIQAMGGWNLWGELPPVLAVCNPCSGVTWSMTQHVSSPSLSGNATKFTLGGTVPYSDALFSNPIMGQGSASLPDTGRTLIPNLHNFTYDAYVYVTNASITQALEFDVNMYLNGVGMEWGTQCNHLADGDWDIWNNVSAHWVSTGAPCNLINNGWNHVTLQVQRESNNDLLYQSITMNGVTYTINQTMAPFSVPSGWYGMTVNYQMDGNYKQVANTTYLDNFTLKYW